MSKLQLSGLEMRFGAVRAVSDVNLDIAQGEFLSLLGPSGCGKTTTLRMIAGFMRPTAGTIAVDGRILSSSQGSVPPEKRGMSMIFQSYAIWPNMTVAQNVSFGLKLRKLSSAEVARRTAEMLDLVKLGHLAERYPAELSGGQQQRVALARAIVIRPQVFLLDEPLSNLDANLREEMRWEIRRLHDAFDMTTVYVTHDQSEAMSTSDRIAVMNNGAVEQVAAPYDIYNHPRTRFVAEFIGRTNIVRGTAGGRGVAALGTELALKGAPGTGGVDISLRPRNITIAAPDAPESRPGAVGVEGTVTSRSYLGESWEYVVQCADALGTVLRVSALPNVRHEVGSRVRLGFLPEDVVVLS